MPERAGKRGSSHATKSKKCTDESLEKGDFESAAPSQAEATEIPLPEYGEKGDIWPELRRSRELVEAGGLGLDEVPEDSRTEMVAEDIIDVVDDRVRISPTSGFPYLCVCHLNMLIGGHWYLGSGCFVGPRTVLTCGHNVFDHGARTWASEVIVTPGRDGDRGRDGESPPRPKFDARTANLRCAAGWKDSGKKIVDIGAIIFNSDVVDDYVGFRSFEGNEEDELRGLTAAVVGYPGQKKGHPDPPNFNTMWGHLRRIAEFNNDRLFYDIDTTPGQSGSPVLYKNAEGNVYIIGIHNYGAGSLNMATRITNPVFHLIKSWTES